MTPDERLTEAVAAFARLDVPPRPELTLPAVTSATGPLHSRRRLMMKLSLGGLAAALVLGLVAITATPSVTMAQAVAEVKKHQFVKYTTLINYQPGKDYPAAGTRDFVYEDLVNRRVCIVECHGNPPTDTMTSTLILLNVASKNLSIINPCPADIEGALGAMKDNTKRDPTAMMTGTTRAQLPAYLARPNAFNGLAKIVFAANLPKQAEEAGLPKMAAVMLAQPPLLEQLRLMASSPGSVTSQVELDGKPAIKIVGRYDDVPYRELAEGKIEGWEGKRPFTIWLEPKTRLPLRIERPSPFGGGYVRAETDFQWDPKLPAGMTPDKLFSTDPPKGYPLTIIVE